MSSKKRKRSRDLDGSSPHGREDRAALKNVSLVDNSNELPPVLASTPGVEIPRSITFDTYAKKKKKSKHGSLSSSHAHTEILLQTSEHSSLDYIVQDQDTTGTEKYLKYYVGIFDPARGDLQLVAANKLVARSVLRAKAPPANEALQAQKEEAYEPYSARNKLGLEFGTKKSRKAINDLQSNAIQISPSKPGRNTDETTLDSASQAIINSLAQVATSMPTRAELQAQVDDGKPRPKARLDASKIEDAYPVEELVGGADNLKKMAVKGWIDSIKAGEDIQTHSLFVSKRLAKVVNAGDVKKIKTLRYLTMMIEWYRSLAQEGKYGRKVPKSGDMNLSSNYGTELILGLNSRFTEKGTLNIWYQDKIKTHILALALTVDDFVMDVYDIRQDLKMEILPLQKLLKEIGCSVRAPTVQEKTHLNITTAESQSHRHAILKLPLEFPKGKTR